MLAHAHIPHSAQPKQQDIKSANCLLDSLTKRCITHVTAMMFQRIRAPREANGDVCCDAANQLATNAKNVLQLVKRNVSSESKRLLWDICWCEAFKDVCFDLESL